MLWFIRLFSLSASSYLQGNPGVSISYDWRYDCRCVFRAYVVSVVGAGSHFSAHTCCFVTTDRTPSLPGGAPEGAIQAAGGREGEATIAA